MVADDAADSRRLKRQGRKFRGMADKIGTAQIPADRDTPGMAASALP
jgi:hypothetical protein